MGPPVPAEKIADTQKRIVMNVERLAAEGWIVLPDDRWPPEAAQPTG